MALGIGLAALNPALALAIGAFRRVSADVPATADGRTVAVIGLSPGAGASTVASVMALAAAGYTANRIQVIDTNCDDPARGRQGGPRVDALLGGRGEGRLPMLLAVPAGEGVARSRVSGAGTPGCAVPVLALPAGYIDFAPQILEQTLVRLRRRADLTIIDTPHDLGAPVFHAVLHLVDHVLLVVRADQGAAGRLAEARVRLAATPGPAGRHDLRVVLVSQSRFVPRWRPDDLPWTMVRHDRALRAGYLGRMSRRSTVTGLELVAAVSGPPDQGV